MTGFDCVCDVVDIFERSLVSGAPDARIRTVGELARRAGYSVYHFTRLFSAILGVTPKEYLSGRVLTEAARRVCDSGEPFVAIARDAGFPDYESFSRAFRKRFGLTPSAARGSGVLPAGCLERAYPRNAALAGGSRELAPSVAEPELVRLAAFEITGLPFHIDEGTPSFARQWATFQAIERRVAGRRVPETFYQFSAWADDDAFTGLSILCALATDGVAAQEPVFVTRRVPEAEYLLFRHAGDMAAIGATYDYIYRVWLAGHEMRPVDLWEFQRYPAGTAATEIFIPVALR
jgi:AraC family transcriptional regulator